MHDFPARDFPKEENFLVQDPDLLRLARCDIDHFYTDFIESKKKQFNFVKQCLKRSRSVLVLRVNLSDEKSETTIRLRDTIADLRGGKPFDLWVFQDDVRDNWGIPNLRTFSEFWEWDWETNRWSGNDAFWDDLFASIKLEK